MRQEQSQKLDLVIGVNDGLNNYEIDRKKTVLNAR